MLYEDNWGNIWLPEEVEDLSGWEREEFGFQQIDEIKF
jgi:hypothetical protein